MAKPLWGESGAGATRLHSLPLTLVAPAPRLALEQISIHNGYTTDPVRIADGYAMEHRWIAEESASDQSSSRTRRKYKVSKLKIEHGVSRIKRAKLQTYIDQTASEDIELMAEWSNNETHYIVNELLRFALTQNEDFQKYKAEQHAKPKNTPSPKLALSQVKPSSDADANPPTPSVVPAVRQ